MFAYQLVLEHPDRHQQIALRVVSDWHYRTVTELLRREGVATEYRDWSILSFQTVPLCAEAAARTRRRGAGCRARATRHRASPSTVQAAARARLGGRIDLKV